MKTVTLSTGHVFGTGNSEYASIAHKGRVLHSVQFHHSERDARVEKLKLYASRIGFTHYKTEVNGKPVALPT